MKLLPTALLLAFALSALAVPSQIDVGTYAAAPYFIEHGEDPPRGAVVDFFDKEIAPRMGVRFRWLPSVTPARLVRGLQDGSFQFTPLLTRSADREAVLWYSPNSYLGFKHTLALRPDHPLANSKSINLSQLQGMTIGWIQAAPLPEALQNQPGVQWDLMGSMRWETANLSKLALGRLDAAYFSNPETPQYYALETGKAVSLVPLPLPERPLYAVFPRNADPALIERYELAAKEAYANRRFEQYLKRYLEKR